MPSVHWFFFSELSITTTIISLFEYTLLFCTKFYSFTDNWLIQFVRLNLEVVIVKTMKYILDSNCYFKEKKKMSEISLNEKRYKCRYT